MFHVYTFFILQHWLFHWMSNNEYLRPIFLSLSFFLEILKILFDLTRKTRIKKKIGKEENYIFNEYSYSTRISPSNNFYLNKQSAIIPNPTYKRATYSSQG